MSSIYLYQDRFVPEEQVFINPADRGYYFGDGIYEVFRVYNGLLYETEAHCRRLLNSLAAVGIPLPMDIAILIEKVQELVRLNEIGTGTVYIQITRGVAPRSHGYSSELQPVLMAYCMRTERPVSAIENGISVITADDIRWLRCDLKTLNLLPNIMAKQQAKEQQADDIVFHRNGIVTESSASNVMIVQHGRLLTHPANHLILHGITRMVVLRLAAKLGIPFAETAFTVDDLYTADEAFITSTSAEITPIVSTDGRVIGQGIRGELSASLQRAFEQTFQIEEN